MAASAEMAAKYEGLKKRRAIVKSACTRIRNFIDAVQIHSEQDIAELQERRERLSKIWDDYDSVQSEIELLDVEGDTDDRELFESSFHSISARLRVLLRAQPAPDVPVQNQPANVNVDNPQNHEQVVNIRLPKLNLPTFSGKYEDWLPFSNAFTSIIHDNHSLSAVQKFQYLQSSLRGEAAGVVHSLELSDENYAVAWNLLKTRYDNSRIIVQTHIKEIIEQPRMIKENIHELRKLVDNTNKHTRALTSLKRPVDRWDDIIVYILTSKLDSLTNKEWQASLKGNEMPTLKGLLDFLIQKCQALEIASKPSFSMNSRDQTNTKRQSTSHVAVTKHKCSFCKGDHPVYACKDFIKMPFSTRLQEIKKRKLCINCMRSTNHMANSCTFGACKTCGSKHNTLLHPMPRQDSAPKMPNSNSESDATVGDSVTSQTAVTTYSSMHADQVMLSTAMAFAYDHAGNKRTCGVLLDCGSQANFVSRTCLETLKLPTKPFSISVCGINQSTTVANEIVRIKLQSRISLFSTELDCIVTDKITGKLPTIPIQRNDIKIPKNIILADPQFHKPSYIDVLVGAGVFWELLCIGQMKASLEHPVLQKTQLGWVLAGRIMNKIDTSSKVQNYHVSVGDVSLHEKMSQFWELDNDSVDSRAFSLDSKYCEDHFARNTSRDPEGRFIVKLPVREEQLNGIGDTKTMALKRLYGQERRFNKNPMLKEKYSEFMREYLALGHMRRIDEDHDSFVNPVVYLPHHAVFKGSKQTSKIRVVFDASAKGASGVSLNDALIVGPVIQQDLLSILLRFRTFTYVFTADIIKMYRQIRVHEEQVRLQRILWREDSSKPVDAFELLTVTYGTASASYLATKCLQTLAIQEAANFPLGSKHVLRDFYMDDVLTGADSIEELVQIQTEIIRILESGNFKLDKWLSNTVEVTRSTKGTYANGIINFNKNEDARILGVRWDPLIDSFQFSIDVDTSLDCVTKRGVLSDIARIFDPLGVLGPVTIIAKLVVQELWKLGLDWDASVPMHIYTQWTQLKRQFADLDDLTIPRCVKFGSNIQDFQIHGFSDASERAYGACVYLRFPVADGTFKVELMFSRSKVAPLKAISLPRLELCAALLLAQMIEKSRGSIDMTQVRVCLWTDSTITLNWISSFSRQWTVFVANRVGEIQRLTRIEQWNHVSSGDNPADLLSRGVEPVKLKTSELWWHGPAWLAGKDDEWPLHSLDTLDEMPEKKRTALSVTIFDSSHMEALISKFSNIDKLVRVIAYCLRFFAILKAHKIKGTPVSPTLTASDLDGALKALCKFVQRISFPDEMRSLKDGKPIVSSSRLLSLSPFMDESGLMRVGGRLKNSDLPYSTRHPILLPKAHHLTRLIIRSAHLKNLHSGVQLTIASVRQEFWPLGIKTTTRRIIRECITCFKCDPVPSQAIMGQLPAPRVKPARPFHTCGVDYAGPLLIREGTRRNAHKFKAYICLFVCFVTRAVHIELVGNLTSESFIAALRRFVARRGKVSCIWSDNGTAFTGAVNEMNEFFTFFTQEQTQRKINEFFLEQRINWTFIPPNAPHFGGLWEAAVKSAKTHLHRVVGNASLTYEEMYTTLCEIESILNSRPLTPLTEDPNDLLVLTPGHFLIGEALNAIPHPDLSEMNENRLSRWQRVEQLKQHFWKRWSLEYLHQLQERKRWKESKGPQLEVGQLVLIKQPGLAPLQWLIGRIQEIHPGADAVVRSATVRTNKGCLVRPLSKLCVLPAN